MIRRSTDIDLSMVCVSSDSATSAGTPMYLRTYPVDRNSVPDCTIIEAVRATFALTGLFKPVVVAEPGGPQSSYVGIANIDPTTQLLDEAAHIIPDRNITCVMSVGAGQKQTGMAHMWFVMIRMLTAPASLVAECERTAQGLENPGIYFRFNVDEGMRDIGMSDWKDMSNAVGHARSYLRLPENDSKMAELVQVIKSKIRVAPRVFFSEFLPYTMYKDLTEYVLEEKAVPATSVKHTIKGCPPPSPLFVGRETHLSRMKWCLVNASEERHVCVLHGLGGAGKTQLARKFAQLYKNE
jgi:hypothetical protein